MIGKAVAATFLVAALLFTGALLYTDKTPRQLINSIARHIAPTATEAPTTSPAATSYTYYTYHYRLEAQGLQTLEYDTEVHIVSRSSDTACFTYRVLRTQVGRPSDARDFMRGFMQAPEGARICTQLDPSSYTAKYYFTKPSITGTAHITYGPSGELHGTARVRGGVLQSMELDGALPGTGHVHLEVTLTAQR